MVFWYNVDLVLGLDLGMLAFSRWMLSFVYFMGMVFFIFFLPLFFFIFMAFLMALLQCPVYLRQIDVIAHVLRIILSLKTEMP